MNPIFAYALIGLPVVVILSYGVAWLAVAYLQRFCDCDLCEDVRKELQ